MSNSRTEHTLYQQVADRVETMIESGVLRAGDRIPSVRHLSRQHRVSIPTVMQAYVQLENRRIIEARPRSGFYVRPRLSTTLNEPAASKRAPAETGLKAFDALMPMARDMIDPSLVPLGGAVPSPKLLPLDKLARITSSIVRHATEASMSYDPAPGCPRLRKELSRRSLEWGCSLKADDFIITTGASEALNLALQATTRPGDTVLVESPAYYGLLHIIAQLKLKVIAIPSSARDGIVIEAAAIAMKRHRVSAMVVTPNFANPSGSLMPEDSRMELLTLAKRHGIPLIEDDIYGDLPHEGERPRCLKALDTGGGVILCGSFSKTLAPGLRVGYIAGGLHHQKIMRMKTALNLGCASLPSLTVAEFLRTGGYDRHLRKLRHTYRQHVCKMREALAVHFPEGTRVSNPSGGFVLWVELPGKPNTLHVFEKARDAGISIAPGPLFSATGEFKNCLRLSCGFPWSERTEAALATLARIVS